MPVSRARKQLDSKEDRRKGLRGARERGLSLTKKETTAKQCWKEAHEVNARESVQCPHPHGEEGRRRSDGDAREAEADPDSISFANDDNCDSRSLFHSVVLHEGRPRGCSHSVVWS